MNSNVTHAEETFEYTYSAKKQEELEQIRKKYVPAEESKMDQLRKLDKSVTRPGTMWGLIIGIVGALVMGGGMSMAMVWGDTLMLPGICIGLTGMVIAGMAYPVHKKITTRQREKLAPQILALIDEIETK